MSTTSPQRHDRGEWITIEGARSNNLKDVSVRVPKHRITVFTGVSGSGKSSLAFGTIAAEAQRLVADTYPLFVRNRLPRTGTADVEKIDGLTFTTIVDQRPFSGNARSTVGTASDIGPLLRLLFSRIGEPSAGFSPAYSFNDPSGMCPRCEGLGVVDDIDLEELIDRTQTLRGGAIQFPTFLPGTYRWKRMIHSRLVDPDVPLGTLPKKVLDALLFAEDLRLEHPSPQYPQSGIFDGVIPRLRNSYLRKAPSRLTTEEREALDRVVTKATCPLCHGARLNAAARASLIHGRSIADWSAMPIVELRGIVTEVTDPGVRPLVTAIGERLNAMDDIGLGYLSLDRISPTLSGGEAQRVKIIRYLGSALSDVSYVFDEPSAGLHPHDVHRLLELLRRLRDAHNTVLVVEHHPVVIAAADHIVELGPAAGVDGGRIEYDGTLAGLRDSASKTGRLLRSPLVVNEAPRRRAGRVTIAHAKARNLRDVTVHVPLGVLTAVSGVAGSGKSTLIASELKRQHPEFTVVTQAPLRGGIRSTPATVLGVAESVRRAFAAATGLQVSWFTSNGRGACLVCKGKGFIVTDLAFLDDVRTTCESCGGKRFNPTSLDATLAGRSIADVLAMNAAQAADFFADRPDIAGPLAWLTDVGLGYVAIGRSTDTLSGGERQRLQLARELVDTTDPASLRIVLDEPTAGLHGLDIDRLLALFDRLVDGGATIVAIEHSQRVIAHADHVIDVGPGAGSSGGRIVYEGPPAGLLSAGESLTGRYLRSAVEPATPLNATPLKRTNERMTS